MEEREYARLCDDLFERLEERLDSVEEDIDYESNRQICEITLPGGSKLIVNQQPPVKEIWLAARDGGYHFRHNGTAWVDTRDGTDFFERFEACLAAQL